jgi:hypothetical protein
MDALALQRAYWDSVKSHFVKEDDVNVNVNDYRFQVQNNWRIDDAAMPLLVRDLRHYKTKLETLALEGCRFTYKGVKVLCAFLREHPTLRSVDLQTNIITSRALVLLVDAFVTMPRLESVNLSSNPLIKDTALPALQRLVQTAPLLTTLVVRRTGLSCVVQRQLAISAERSFSLSELMLDRFVNEQQQWDDFIEFFTYRNDVIRERLEAKHGMQRASSILPSTVMLPEEYAIRAPPPLPTTARKRKL